MYVEKWAVRGRLGDHRALCEEIAKVLPVGWVPGQPAEAEARGRQWAEVAARARGVDPATWPESTRFEPIAPKPLKFRKMVRDRMAEVGINTYQLAVLAGIAPRTLAYWMRGDSDEIGDQKLAAVLAALGIMGDNEPG